MRNRFDEQLNVLNSEMIRMGALCEEVIALAAKALGDGDASLAKRLRRLTRRSTKKSARLKRSASGFYSSSSPSRATCARSRRL